MSISTDQGTSLARPAEPQAVDTHLIMNAMNQIAARDISISGIENPLLFALSDYLRESLSKLDVAVVSVRTDVRLTEAHLMLHACVAHSTIEMVVLACPNEPFKVPRGTFPELAIRSLKGMKLPPRGQWHLQLAFERSEQEARWINFSMAFSVAGPWAGADLQLMHGALATLPAVLGGNVVVDTSRTISSAHGTTLFFRVRLAH